MKLNINSANRIIENLKNFKPDAVKDLTFYKIISLGIFKHPCDVSPFKTYGEILDFYEYMLLNTNHESHSEFVKIIATCDHAIITSMEDTLKNDKKLFDMYVHWYYLMSYVFEKLLSKEYLKIAKYLLANGKSHITVESVKQYIKDTLEYENNMGDEDNVAE